MKSFIQFYKNLSLRTKLIILLVSVPLLMLSSYLALVLRVVEVDKMGYVYETSVNLSKSFSAQVKSDLSMALLKLQPLLQSYLTRGYWDSFDQGLFAKESEFWVLAVLNPANGEALPFIEKNLGIWADFKVAQSALVDEIKNLAPGKRIIKGIGDQKLVIAETISDEKTKKQLTYLFIYWAKDIGGIFESGQGTKIYLVDKNGKALLGPVDFKETDLLERFPQKITGKLNSSKALDSAEILVSEKDQMQWLVSISNSGFGDLAVVSLIEKSQALAALKILLLKSIVFFVLLVALSIIISLFFSKYLTAALRLLVDATKRIATGRFDVQWQADSLDEVGVLSSNFRVMSDEIQRLLIETKDNARMEAELKTAQIVQSTLFPKVPFNEDGVEIIGRYEPASECGGDWWSFSRVDDKVYLWIGDATGHGAPAALVTSAARSAASIVEAQKLTPAEAMKLMNLAIYDVANGEIMMTFFMATYDILSGQMTYVNASHEFPILVNRANETSFSKKDLQHIMDSNHPRLGEKRDTVFKEKTIQLKKGDLIFFYTDGLSDLRNADQVSLGERNFYKQLFVALKQQKLSEFMRTMETSLSQFRGTASLVDDVTYFVLSVEEGADASFGDSTTDDESMDAVVDF